MDLLQQIDKQKVPQHIAIIMDGNGRWAKQQGESRIYGHYEGVNSVREVVEAAGEIGVKFITLYAFSTENWNRPKEEVDALMELLVSTISGETPELNKKNVRFYPCNHVIYCYRCVQQMNKCECPVCKSAIQTIQYCTQST